MSSPYVDQMPGVARATRGIDQCLDRLGELRQQAAGLREHLEKMDEKLHGPQPQPSELSTKMSANTSNDVEELDKKLSDLQHLLNIMRDRILSINSFINASIN
jgi:chromosome segregation ATPase